jgi:hypothetical protein
MHFTKAILTSMVSVSLISASAVLPRSESETLQKRDNGANCNFQYALGNSLSIQVTTWGYWADDWGNTLLQNLYNQCGAVNGWGFWYDNGDNSQTGHASFSIREYNTACVQNAIWLASDPSGAVWGVECQDTTECATC